MLCRQDDSRRTISWYLHRLPPRTGYIADLSCDPVISLEINGSGTIERSVEGQRQKAALRTDTLTLTPAFVTCDWRWCGQPLDVLDVYIPYELLQGAWSTHFSGSPRNINLAPSLTLKDDALVFLMKSLLATISSRANTFTMIYEAFTDHLIYSLLTLNHDAIRPQAAPQQGLSRLALCRVRDYIDSHLADDLSLQSLAVTAGLSRFHFQRLFQSTMGQSPHSYVTQRRLAHASRQLCETRLSVSEIAAQCGYQDPSYFARCFRERFKMGPSKFRRSGFYAVSHET